MKVFYKLFNRIWNSKLFYPTAGLFFVLIRIPLFLFSDATMYHEDYARGQIAREILDHGFSNGFFLFADNYALGSFFSGLWICPFFRFLGPTYLAMKIAALTFSVIALMLWIRLFSSAISFGTGRIIGLLLIFSPPMLQRFQLITMGFHSEGFLFIPLTFMLASYILHPRINLSKMVLSGLLFGLIAAYCLTNIVAVAIALSLLFFSFQKSRHLKEYFCLMLSATIGFSPWLWLNFANYQGKKIFTVLQTREHSILNAINSLYDFVTIYFPQSIISFTSEPPLVIIYLIIIIAFFFFILAAIGWREGFLTRCFLLYPVVFIAFYLIVNPDLPRIWHTYPNLVRMFIPLVYAYLGICTLAFQQVKKYYPHLLKPSRYLFLILGCVFTLNLWVNITALYPIGWTAYNQEPGYIPLYRNLSVAIRYLERADDLGSGSVLPLRNLLNTMDLESPVNVQLCFIIGSSLGQKQHFWNGNNENFRNIIMFSSQFDKTKRNLFFQGLGYGFIVSKNIFRHEIDFQSFYGMISEEEWKAFNVGLINACFILKNPMDLWAVLEQWSRVNNLPLTLPPVETRFFIEKYIHQISVLGFPCMFTPGAIRGYVHMFEKDPVSLQLLGWWLAKEIAPDEEWLYLKLGSDFQECSKSISRGMSSFKAGLPFVNILCPAPLQFYKPDERERIQKEPGETFFISSIKPIYPFGGFTKDDIEKCNIILKRGWQ